MVIFTSRAVPPGQRSVTTVWKWFTSDDQIFNYKNDNAYDIVFWFAANDDTHDNCDNYNDNQGTINILYLLSSI